MKQLSDDQMTCARTDRRSKRRTQPRLAGLFTALIAAAFVAVLGAGCASSGAELGDRVAIPRTPWVDLSAEDRSEAESALSVATDVDQDPNERAEAYLLVAEANLLLWDELQRKIDALDETQGDEFEKMTQAGRVYYMQGYRARARSWAVRASNDPKYIQASPFEKRFGEAWDYHDDPQAAYDRMTTLLGEVLSARGSQYMDVNFVSDLRYSAAIFYTLLGKPATDMTVALQIANGNEAEAVRFAGDVAYLYEQLVARPDDAADAYRAIAETKPTTREGFEAQVAVLEALRKKQRIGAMEAGSADSFDTSSAGVALFETVNQDLGRLVEINAHRDKWTGDTKGGSNTDSRAEEVVREFTVRMHGLAQQQDSPALYELAVSAYDKYHLLFPTSGYRYEMFFFHAEALYHLKRYADAYQRYKAALGANAQGSFREDIVRNLVRSGYEMSRKEPLPAVAADTRQEIPEAHRDFISSGEQFITVLGESDPDMAGFVRYEIIKRHYLYGENRVAEPLAEDFVRFESDHPQAKKAAVVWLDLLARDALDGGEREQRSLERAIERVRTNSALVSNELVKAKLDKVSQTPPVADGRVPD